MTQSDLQEHADRRWQIKNTIFKLAIVLIIAVFSGFLGEIYVNVAYGAGEADYWRGFRTGFTIGLISSLIEVYYIRSVRRSWIRQVAFLPGLIVRIIVLTLIVRVSLLGNELLTLALLGQPLIPEFVLTEEIRDTVFSMSAVVLIVVLSQLSSIVGLKRFTNLVVGRYFKPVSEDRLFLFVDLNNSSALTNELGNVRFHEFLSEFFLQLDYAIVRFGGEIVSYVGDSVIITWPMDVDKRKNSRALEALRMMQKILADKRQEFQSEFGTAPEFRAALHGGSVVIGECGDSRRQLTFLGDAVNVTARIEQIAKSEGEQFLASGEIVSKLNLPANMAFQKIGKFPLKGYPSPMEIFKIVIA